jgi:pimeloyl-ACP methyl ester carboxylesterase
MLTDFQAAEIQTAETSISTQRFGPAGFAVARFSRNTFDVARYCARAGATFHRRVRRPAWRQWADDVRGQAIDAGHFFPEEKPERTVELLREFLPAD